VKSVERNAARKNGRKECAKNAHERSTSANNMNIRSTVSKPKSRKNDARHTLENKLRSSARGRKARGVER
jgi:hypothetical protein